MKIAVVITIYNAAQYLREALESLVAQTFTEWECICIDDGSTDESGAILKEFATRDARFRLYHQANAGVVLARNLGLQKIRTPWFMFMDADDVYHPKAFEILYDATRTHPKADVITAGYSRCLDDLTSEGTETIVNDPVERMCTDTTWRGMPWARLLRSDVFSGLAFVPVFRYHDDVAYTTAAMMQSKCEILLSAPLYYWRDTPGSMTKHTAECMALLPELWRYQARVCPRIVFRLGEIVFAYLKKHDTTENRLLVRNLKKEGIVSFARLSVSKRIKLLLKGIV